MKHISVRVPWHDNGWNSHVCANPRCNTFCKQLPNIVNSKVDCEQLSCGIDWSKLTTKERPACAGENGGFMNYKAYEREFIHNPELHECGRESAGTLSPCGFQYLHW